MGLFGSNPLILRCFACGPLERRFDAATVYSINLSRCETYVAFRNFALSTCKATQIPHNLFGGRFRFGTIELLRKISPDNVTYSMSNSPFGETRNQRGWWLLN